MKPKVWDTIYAVCIKGFERFQEYIRDFDIKIRECIVEEIEGNNLLMKYNSMKFVLDYESFWFSNPYIMEEGKRKEVYLLTKGDYSKQIFYHNKDDFKSRIREEIRGYNKILLDYYLEESPRFKSIFKDLNYSFENFYWKDIMDKLDRLDNLLSEINFKS